MKTNLAVIFGGFLLIGLAGAAQAAVGSISNNNQPTTGTNGPSYVSAGSLSTLVAQSFTTGPTNYLLNSASLNMAGGSGGNFALSIYSDSGNSPGSLITTFSGSSTPGTGFTVYTTNANVVLNPHTTYWLEAAINPATDAQYGIRTTTSTTFLTSQGWTEGPAADNINNGGWVTDPNNLLFSINAFVTTPTPEPSTLALAALGAGAFLAYRRRQK